MYFNILTNTWKAAQGLLDWFICDNNMYCVHKLKYGYWMHIETWTQEEIKLHTASEWNIAAVIYMLFMSLKIFTISPCYVDKLDCQTQSVRWQKLIFFSSIAYLSSSQSSWETDVLCNEKHFLVAFSLTVIFTLSFHKATYDTTALWFSLFILTFNNWVDLFTESISI